jgi:hypothetical protein
MLHRLLHGIAKRREQRRLYAQNPMAATMRRLVPKCLVCEGGPVAHHFAQIASMPCNEETKPRVKALFYHVKNHEWESLKDFKEFRADQDDAIAYAVTGPHEGGMVILTRDPLESYARVELYLEETVTAEEIGRIKGLVSENDWQEL